MKKNLNLVCLLLKQHRKKWIVMRNTILILLISAFQVYASDSYAQTKTISLAMNNATISEVLSAIQNQSEFYFLYNSELIDVTKKVDVEIEGEKVDAILARLFNKEEVDFLIKDRYIVLTPVGGNAELFAEQQQQPAVSGTVTDEAGEPLPGVTVVAKGTTQGTVTNADGEYSLTNLPEDATLQFSFVGMLSQEIEVGNQTTIDVTMAVDAIGIEEVVAIGYGSQKKSTLTGAVSEVNMKDLNKREVPNLVQALQGQVPGVHVIQNSGQPGDAMKVTIRGESTFGSDNGPLFIVDGVPGSAYPKDIESITVLKDASAAAIYGARATNGVILITTKSGKKGEEKIEFNYYEGVHKVGDLPTMMNSEQWLNYQKVAWDNAGYGMPDENPYLPYINGTALSNTPWLRVADTDWLDEMFEIGHSREAFMSVSGGTEKTNYYFSGVYNNYNGVQVYDNDFLESYGVSSKIETKLHNRLSVGLKLNINYRTLGSGGMGGGNVSGAMHRPPVLAVFKDPSDPTYKEDDPFTDLPFYLHNNQGTGGYPDKGLFEQTGNPVARQYHSNDKRNNFSGSGVLFLNLDLLGDKSLQFKTNLLAGKGFKHRRIFRRNYGDDMGASIEIDRGKGRHNLPNSLEEAYTESFNMTWNNVISYNKEFNKHSVSALIGTELIRHTNSNTNAKGQRFEYQNEEVIYLDNASSNTSSITNNQTVWGGAGQSALYSYFASGTYVYDSRYMLTANVRADASTNFGPNNKWGYFPSVSAGWKMSKESFMNDVSWLSDLKFRASLGQLGNQGIPAYMYQTRMEKQGDKYVITRYSNPDVKWETSIQKNIGVDFGILKNKIYLTADYYNKTTKDALLPINVPAFIGNVDPTYFNSGSILNRGFEFSVTYRGNYRDFSYSVGANCATQYNEVIKMHPVLPVLYGGNMQYLTKTEVGHPLNSYWGLVFDGIYQNEEEIKEQLYNTPEANLPKPGDIRFKDLDGDGTINTSTDRDYIGDPYPDFTYGINLQGEYKGFSVAILAIGVKGIDRYSNIKREIDFDSRAFNHTTTMLNYWNGDGTSNTIPRPTLAGNGGYQHSSLYLEDASFFRIKNLEVAYSFSDILKRKSKMPISDIRLYVTMENLLTITDFTGTEPETVTLNNQGTVPQPHSFIFGINVKF